MHTSGLSSRARTRTRCRLSGVLSNLEFRAPSYWPPASMESDEPVLGRCEMGHPRRPQNFGRRRPRRRCTQGRRSGRGHWNPGRSLPRRGRCRPLECRPRRRATLVAGATIVSTSLREIMSVGEFYDLAGGRGHLHIGAYCSFAGTASTGQGATWRSRCVTLPRRSPLIGPCPRVPMTMRSAPASLALSAMMCATFPATAE